MKRWGRRGEEPCRRLKNSMERSAFLHMLDGRLRVKVADVKGSPRVAALVEAQLAELQGVDDVSANPLTGSVLVLYDPAQVGVEEIMEVLRAGGHLRQPAGHAGGTGGSTGSGLGAIMLRAAAEFAIRHPLTALI